MTVTYLTLVIYLLFFFFKQKTAYEMRISDWSSDVCSSDLVSPASAPPARRSAGGQRSAARDRRPPAAQPRDDGDRKSVGQGQSVSVRVGPGGRRIIQINNIKQTTVYTKDPRPVDTPS